MLLRTSMRTMPGMTAACGVALLASVLVLPLTALSLRWLVDAMSSGPVTRTIVAAVGAALALATSLATDQAVTLLLRTAGDRLGRRQLHPDVHRSISEMEGIEHLERSSYLDRVTIVRGGTSVLASSLWGTASAVASVLKVVVTTLLLAASTPVLLLLSLAALAPVNGNRRGQRTVKEAEVRTAEDFRLQQHLFDVVTTPSSAKDVWLSGIGQDLTARQGRLWREVHRARTRAQAISSAWTSAGWLVFVAVFVAGLLTLTHGVSAGTATAGDVVLVVVVSTRLQQAVADAVRTVGTTLAARRVVEPFWWLRRLTVADQERRAARQLQPPPALHRGIRVSGLSFTYPGTEQCVLSEIDVDLPAGAVVAVVGEYGSGKTTLVKLLARFYEPTSGTITVDGEDLADIDTESWRSRTAAAFQDFGRFHVTVREGVGIGQMSRLHEPGVVEEALSSVDQADFTSGLPNGIDTQLGAQLGGVELSEGQWQRIALARAAMRPSPLLLLLDEPTASIDAPGEAAIYRQFMALSRRAARAAGAITVLVSHRFSTVRDADVIVVMEHGRIVERGNHASLLRHGGRYAEMFKLQADAYAAELPEGTEA